MHLLRGHWQLILITVLIFLLWNTPAVLPLKLLVVFLHEMAHALAGIITGGSVVEISLSPQQGGHARIRGGNLFLIASAGYLGSLLLGMALFLIALRSNADKLVLGLFGGIVLLVTALYIRDLFAVIFCILTGLGMLAIARYLDRAFSDMALRIIGLTSMIYAPYDIYSDIIARSGLRSDARLIAEEFGGPTLFWGGLWLILSLAAILYCLRYGIGEDSNLTWGNSTRDQGMDS